MYRLNNRKFQELQHIVGCGFQGSQTWPGIQNKVYFVEGQYCDYLAYITECYSVPRQSAFQACTKETLEGVYSTVHIQQACRQYQEVDTFHSSVHSNK